MATNWQSLGYALAFGSVVVCIVQLSFERLSRRMGIKDVSTLTAVTMFASVAACTAVNVYFLGPWPLPNLITPPILFSLCLLCLLLMSYLPGEKPTAPPTQEAPQQTNLAREGARDYLEDSIGSIVRAAIVAMQVVVLRSGSPI